MKLPIHNYKMLTKKPEESQENEIRVKANARPFIYAAYAGKLLFEKKYDRVFMLATGTATAKVIQSVEYIRKRVRGLLVCYEIESTEFVDEYEPTIEGLDHVQVKRLVPTLKAHLFLNAQDPLKNKPGFMPALPENQLLDEEKFKLEIEDHFKKERRTGEDGGERRPPRPRGYANEHGDRPFRGGRGRRHDDEGEHRDFGDRPRARGRGRFRGNDREREQGDFRGEEDREPRPYRGNRYRGDGYRNEGYRNEGYQQGERRGNFRGGQGQEERSEGQGGYRGNYRGDRARSGRGRFPGNRGGNRPEQE